MSDRLFSPSWYRAAALKPRLRAHAQIHRHDYRGQVWYVLQDHSSARFHRFTPSTYAVIGLMDGERTVEQLWETAIANLGEDAPTQDEILQLLGQLHAADVLQCDVTPDSQELFGRHQRRLSLTWKQRLASPLSMRFGWIDPERFLARAMPYVRPLFTWTAALIWLLVVGAALVQVGVHWTELTQNLVDRALAPRNLLLLWLIYPAVKILHELGHAFATKAWGGEVHEMGILLLVFMPLPYVDASAASAFRDKKKRMLVGAAGMIVELFLAAIAVFVWLNVETGLVRAVAYNVILIAGASTILFNGNPLLRYDGYYILADAIEIPNLAQRSGQYLTYLFERRIVGIKDAQSPVTAPGEPAWFFTFGTLSFLYRTFIVFGILLFVADRFFGLGVLLAVWAAGTLIVLPVWKSLSYVLVGPRLRDRRATIVTVGGLIAAAVVVGVTLVPLPLWSCAEGVVWLPQEAFVRAQTDGFVRRLVVPPNTRVKRGDPLIECEDPILPAHVRALEWKVKALDARLAALQYEDRVQAEITKQEIAAVSGDLARARERAADLVIMSPADGVFVVPHADDVAGRFLKQGEVAGYVIDPTDVTARVIVSQGDIALVRERTRAVEVRLAERANETLPAVIRREVPGASDKLPSTALGSGGGGGVAVDPRDTHGTKAFEKLFQYDIGITAELPAAHFGGRVYVRFDHGSEPIAARWYRAVRRLFLSRFEI